MYSLLQDAILKDPDDPYGFRTLRIIRLRRNMKSRCVLS